MRQLVASDYKFNDAKAHAPTKEFKEVGFQYNLDGKKPQYTDNASANTWIDDFAVLNIDVFNLIKKEHTLPDLHFIKRRYYQTALKNHPDKGGNSHEAMNINRAY